MDTDNTIDTNKTTDSSGATSASPPATALSGRAVWRTVGAVFSVLVIGAGILTAAAWLARRSETQHQVYHHQVGQIVMDVGTGDLTLVRGQDGAVDVTRRLTWSWSKPKIEESWDDNVLTARVTCSGVLWGAGCGVDYTVRVPDDAEIDVRTSTGDIRVTGIGGNLRLAASTGDISVVNARGSVYVRTSTGDINATGLTSDSVDVRASTGDIYVRCVDSPDRVNAGASTGDVTIAVPRGEPYRVTTDASTGDVHVGVAQDPDASRAIDVRTSTGDIDVRYG